MELSANEREELQNIFSILDRDKENNVTARDLANVMKALGRTATDSEMQSIINEADIDGNGFIEFNEFVVAMLQRMNGNADDDDLREAFRVFDKENTGFVGPDQLSKVFIDLEQIVGDDEIDELIQVADQDGDGRLSYEEFVQMMTTK